MTNGENYKKNRPRNARVIVENKVAPFSGHGELIIISGIWPFLKKLNRNYFEFEFCHLTTNKVRIHVAFEVVLINLLLFFFVRFH